MAIFIPGLPCAVCSRPVADGDQVLFPAFTGNQADPIYTFSDAIAHRRCFEESPFKGRIESATDQLKQMQWHRFCVVCAREITDPDEYYPLMELTDNDSNPLWRWNFTQFHRSCLPKWEHRAEVVECMRNELQSGRWKGPAMDRLIAGLEKAGRHPTSVR
jgi:predicted nucleic acid-binding Zn ribbon protein